VSKPTPAQEAEALALWEAGDLEGIVALVVARDGANALLCECLSDWPGYPYFSGRPSLLTQIETHLSATKESK